MLCCVSQRFLSLPSARNMRGFFSHICCGNLVKLLEVNLTILWCLCMTGSIRSFQFSDLYTLSLQQFANYSSGLPTPRLVPVAITACESLLQSCDSWYSPVSPILGAVVCPVTSLLFQIQEELLLFQSVQLFNLLLGWRGDFQALYVWNWKLEVPAGASKVSVHAPNSNGTREKMDPL